MPLLGYLLYKPTQIIRPIPAKPDHSNEVSIPFERKRYHQNAFPCRRCFCGPATHPAAPGIPSSHRPGGSDRLCQTPLSKPDLDWRFGTQSKTLRWGCFSPRTAGRGNGSSVSSVAEEMAATCLDFLVFCLQHH